MVGNAGPVKRSKKGSRLKYLIAVLIAVIVIVAVLAVVYLSPKLPSATEFFDIVPTKSIGSFTASNNRSVAITTLGLNVTPVLGDATIIFISVRSHNDKADESNQAGNITKGETLEFAILLDGYVTTRQNINGTDVFPVDIQIGSVQCQYETTTLYLKPEDIYTNP
jgi:hypothetical protein